MRSINVTEVGQLYEHIRLFYKKVKMPTPMLADQLVKIFDGYSFEELTEAVTAWSKRRSNSPMPADLITEVKSIRYAKYMEVGYRRYEDKPHDCKYCGGTNYMPIETPDGYGLYAPCVHSRAKSMERIKKYGAFRFNCPSKGINTNLRWDEKKRAFVFVEKRKI